MITNNRGFTLPEIMVAMAIFSILIAGIINSKLTQSEQSITQLQAAELQQNVRGAIFFMKREMRMSGFNNLAKDYGSGVIQATPIRITFSFVTDNQGNQDTITYQLSDQDSDGDTDIQRTINGAPDLLAENITAPGNVMFQYFDDSNPPTELDPTDAGFDPDDIRSVVIRITAQLDIAHRSAAGPANNSRTLITRVFMRNMGLR